jgi:ABC-2 type transport system permease protein
MRPFFAVIVRLMAFVGKEIIETLRRPGAVLSLVLGPFLIMAVFGLGYSGVKRPLETIIVAPASSGLPVDVETYQELAGGGLHIAEVTQDRAAAEGRLHAGTVDVVLVAPDDPEAQFRAGQQSVIEVLIDAVDPVAENYAGFLASGLSSAINRDIIRRAAAEGQGYAIAAGQPEVAAIPPDVIAAPTTAEIVNIAPTTPGVTSYFAPAVLALILQHLAVTLVAMSLVRERTSGVIELFRIAPVSTAEVLVGKLLAFGLIGGAIATATVALLVLGLGVPLIGPLWLVVLAVGLLLLASICVGLLIAVVSDSERQAVQLSLLVLLASVFFSGFVLPITEFSEPVRSIAYALPVTHGIRLLQDLMLRGTTNHAWELVALGVIALVTLVLAWILLRRGMTRA